MSPGAANWTPCGSCILLMFLVVHQQAREKLLFCSGATPVGSPGGVGMALGMAGCTVQYCRTLMAQCFLSALLILVFCCPCFPNCGLVVVARKQGLVIPPSPSAASPHIHSFVPSFIAHTFVRISYAPTWWSYVTFITPSSSRMRFAV
jgi:hypothetical protein